MTNNPDVISVEPTLRKAAYEAAFKFLDSHAERKDQMPKEWTYAIYETNKMQVNWLAEAFESFAILSNQAVYQAGEKAGRESGEKVKQAAKALLNYIYEFETLSGSDEIIEGLDTLVFAQERAESEAFRLEGAGLPDGCSGIFMPPMDELGEAQAQITQLKKELESLRGALEKTPHDLSCEALRYKPGQPHVLRKAREEFCKCWKSKALNTNSHVQSEAGEG